MHQILITGGAGYIGSHTAFLLSKLGYQIVIIDAFFHNQPFAPSWATVIKGNIEDKKLLHEVFKNYSINAVMHFAASIEVGESVKHPAQFYQNNVVATLNLLNTMRAYNINKFIFSSSCAVYGIPQYIPLDEQHIKNPISPYGKTKLIVEMILEDFSKAYGLRSVSLRYFNAAGTLSKESLGEHHDPETHLIPLLLASAHEKKTFNVFGNNYPTQDGTAIRDYIHVLDIAQAHVLALEYLEQKNPSDCFNLGTGNGISVQEIIAVINKVCKSHVSINWTERRIGDPPILVSQSKKAEQKLGWSPKYSSIETIIESAYEFYLQKKVASFTSTVQHDNLMPY